MNISTHISYISAPTLEVFQLIKEKATLLGVKGIGMRTLKKYWNEEPIDIDEIIELENGRLEITYIPKTEQLQDAA